MTGRGCGFHRITEMIFNYLIATVSLKAAEIGMSEVYNKKSTLLPPSPMLQCDNQSLFVFFFNYASTSLVSFG